MRAMRSQTRTGALTARLPMPEEKKPFRPGREMMKNLAVSAALVLCAVALRSGAAPGLQAPVDAVLTAVTDDSLLNDRLGKLSFVSAMFPEAAMVFAGQQEGLISPPTEDGHITHAWSRQEPYTLWQTAGSVVSAPMDGEVTGVLHGEGEELMVRIEAPGGLVCVTGNLASAQVQTGDRVRRGQCLGELLPGREAALEVRQHGLSIDPAALLP